MEKPLATRPPIINGRSRSRLCRLVFLGILLSLLYSLASHTLLHQLCKPVIRYPYVDPSYWIIALSGIPEWLTSHGLIAFLFDTLLFALCLTVLLFPHRRAFVILFFLLYLLYFLTFNLYAGMHVGYKVGILVITIPFMASTAITFNLLWEGLRYFTLFVYADAFIWKLLRGTWRSGEQGIRIIKENMAPYLYFHPNTGLAAMYYRLLQHPWLPDLLFKTGFVLEGMFLVGFFTRHYDRYLLVASLLLPVGFYLLADVFFFELSILSLSLLDWSAVFDEHSLPAPLPSASRP